MKELVSFGKNEAKVMDWIEDYFPLNEIEIEDFPFFPHGKLVRDKTKKLWLSFGMCFMDLWIIDYKKHRSD